MLNLQQGSKNSEKKVDIQRMDIVGQPEDLKQLQYKTDLYTHEKKVDAHWKEVDAQRKDIVALASNIQKVLRIWI